MQRKTKKYNLKKPAELTATPQNPVNTVVADTIVLTII